MKCPSCGRQTAGKFCSECGAALAAATCTSCGAPLSPGGRFCHLCGAPPGTQRRAGSAGGMTPWVVAASAVAVTIVALVARSAAPSAPTSANGALAGGGPGGSAAPASDISTMTPRERADRLFDRVMRAAAGGDSAEITFFAPMAIQSYGMLDALDADARYHIGLLEAETGNVAGMLAQADTLERASAGHLFVLLLRAEAAKRSGDGAELARLYRRFLDAYEREQATGKQEYHDHQPALDTFREAARAAVATAR